MLKSNQVKIFCDGGARGNPGPAAAAFVVEDAGKVVFKKSVYLGETTNNVAEYGAVTAALSWIKENPLKITGTEVSLVLDSELVAKQMLGLFKIKNENLKKCFLKAKTIEKEIGIPVKYFSVPREKNKLADFLVNQELDENE